MLAPAKRRQAGKPPLRWQFCGLFPVLLLACLLVLPSLAPAWAEETEGLGAITFSIVADSHICSPTLKKVEKSFLEPLGLKPCPDGKAREDRFLEVAGKVEGEFVVHMGDHIEDLMCCFMGGDCKPYPYPFLWPEQACQHFIPTPRSYGELESVAYYAEFAQDFTRISGLPLHMVLGNHDIRTIDITHKDQMALRPDKAKKHWKAATDSAAKHHPLVRYAYPEKFSTMTSNQWMFIFMNSGEGCETKAQSNGICFTPRQVTLLRDSLLTARTNGLAVVLFWHVDPWHSAIEKCQDHPADCIADHDYLAALFDFKDVVKGVFTGHRHVFDCYEWETIHFWTVGSTGYPDQGYKDLYAKVTLGADGMVTIDNADSIHWFEDKTYCGKGVEWIVYDADD